MPGGSTRETCAGWGPNKGLRLETIERINAAGRNTNAQKFLESKTEIPEEYRQESCSYQLQSMLPRLWQTSSIEPHSDDAQT
jgi:hypothetical protein